MDERDKKVNLRIKNRIERLSNSNLKEDLIAFTKALRIGYGLKPVKSRTIEGYVDILIQLNKLKPNKRFLDYRKEDLLEYLVQEMKKDLQKFLWIYTKSG